MVKIVVSNEGPPFDPVASASRPGGISNTRDRLKVLYGDAASLAIEPGARGGTVATLRLPFREVALEHGDAFR
jgi:LytS/YehU family sensor histidine kinase